MTSAAWLGLALAGQVWIVDVQGGPGSDFTQIQPAVDAASDGDVVLVKPGFYASFTLSKGLAILAEPGAAAQAVVRIQNLAADQQALLSGLEIVTLHVTNSDGTVLLSDLRVHPDLAQIPFSSAEHVRVDDCHDVRLHRSTIASPGPERGIDALFVYDARLEIADCGFKGQDGSSAGALPAAGGGHGLRLGPLARVQLAQSSVFAGHGGAARSGSPFPAGDGGDGIHLSALSELVASSSNGQRIFGGHAGTAATCLAAGFSGDGVELELGASARLSGLVLQAGAASCSGHSGAAVLDPGGGAQFPAPIDPVLTATWTGLGSPLEATFQFWAPPNANARFFLGRKPLVGTPDGSVIEQLCTHDRIIDLGSTGAGGPLQVVQLLPGSLPKGFAIFAQVDFLDHISGSLSRTNSTFLVRP